MTAYRLGRTSRAGGKAKSYHLKQTCHRLTNGQRRRPLIPMTLAYAANFFPPCPVCVTQ